MKVFSQPREFPTPAGGVSLAFGVFDGVHIGHQDVLRRTLTQARSREASAVAVTFDRHPNSLVAPDRAPLLLQPLAQKLELIARCGMDATWLIPFDEPFSQQTGDEFMRMVLRDFRRLAGVFVGERFQFGHRRSGDFALLLRLGREHGFLAQAVAPVCHAGRPVSSTRIREAIQTGRLDDAATMLGRPWTFAGIVARGQQLGRQLGFPTANLEAHGLVLPPLGVYAARVRFDGVLRPAVVNVGFRPTVATGLPEPRVEAHLLDVEQDLYGRTLEVEFAHHLRDERQFDSLAALRGQIARDIETAKQWLANPPAR